MLDQSVLLLLMLWGLYPFCFCVEKLFVGVSWVLFSMLHSEQHSLKITWFYADKGVFFLKSCNIVRFCESST